MKFSCKIFRKDDGWTWQVASSEQVLAKSVAVYDSWQDCVKGVYEIGEFMFNGVPEKIDTSECQVINLQAIKERM